MYRELVFLIKNQWLGRKCLILLCLRLFFLQLLPSPYALPYLSPNLLWNKRKTAWGRGINDNEIRLGGIPNVNHLGTLSGLERHYINLKTDKGSQMILQTWPYWQLLMRLQDGPRVPPPPPIKKTVCWTHYIKFSIWVDREMIKGEIAGKKTKEFMMNANHFTKWDTITEI